MPEITGIDRELIASTMQSAHIPGVSIAYVDGETHTLSTTTIGTTDTRDSPFVHTVHPDTVFGAASLSKPVFAYLVLKLIDQGMLSRSGEPAASGLDRPLHEILPLEEFFRGHGEQLNKKDIERAKSITPRMLLSHSSGLGERAALVFNPSTEYAYSGTGLVYLQEVIERVTGKSLEKLAQKHVFQPLGMTHSSFLSPGSFLPPDRPGYMAHTISSHVKSKKYKAPNAAHSLHTTASDYATLMTSWMQDTSPIMKQAFEPQISLTTDRQKLPGETKAAARYVRQEIKERLAWGLGIGLELDEHDKAVKAFHTGDMNQFRAQMALDLEKKSCVVYFSNANDDKQANGHVLAPQIITPVIPINYAHTWFYSKFPFAWKAEQLPTEKRQLAFGLRAKRGEDSLDAATALMNEFGTEPKPVVTSTESPRGWFAAAQDIKDRVIQQYWERYIKLSKLSSFNADKVTSLKQCLEWMSSPPVSEANDIFDKILEGECERAEFDRLFANCHPELFRHIDAVEDFHIAPDIPLIKEKDWVLHTTERDAIDTYCRDSRFSASISLQDTAGTVFNTTHGYGEMDRPIYAMHSVGKVFTGVLALTLIHQKKIPADILEQRVVLPEQVLSALPHAVQERLKEVTLHQLMTHQAGLGDYLSKYCEAIGSSISSATPAPRPIAPQDFLPYADESLSEIGKQRYSNLGILLTGLAIEHAYKSAHPDESDTNYNALLHRFITEPAGMECFFVEKPDSPAARYNAEDKLAPYIAGSPAGGYWTSAEDLQKFGSFIYEQCRDEEFLSLVKRFGQEFYDEKSNTVQHAGGIPSSSAFLSVSLTDGSSHAILSDQPNTAIMLHHVLNRSIGKFKIEETEVDRLQPPAPLK